MIIVIVVFEGASRVTSCTAPRVLVRFTCDASRACVWSHSSRAVARSATCAVAQCPLLWPSALARPVALPAWT